MMICKNICERYKYKRSPHKSVYQKGVKRCQTCEIYIYWEGIRCPCCSTKLRSKNHISAEVTRAKNKRNRERRKREEEAGYGMS